MSVPLTISLFSVNASVVSSWPVLVVVSGVAVTVKFRISPGLTSEVLSHVAGSLLAPGDSGHAQPD